MSVSALRSDWGFNANGNSTPKVKRPRAISDLPPYPPVVRQLLRLTASDDIPLSRIQQVLRTDAAFTADVMRLANSAMIGALSPITGVLHAIAMLGLERIKVLATVLILRTFLTEACPNGAMRSCWRHNLATAFICERLGRILRMDADTCYTAGLLHDVGRLALLRAHPERYDQLLEMEATDGFDLLSAEQAAFDINHCEAGRWILAYWEFPQALCDAVALHHETPRPDSPAMLRVVHAGWQVADLLGFCVIKHPHHRDIAGATAYLPARARDEIIKGFHQLPHEVACSITEIENSLA